MKDLNARIRQLTKLILTSQSVDESKGDDSRPGSPVKIDFDMSPYQVIIYPSWTLVVSDTLSMSEAPTGTFVCSAPTRDTGKPDPLARGSTRGKATSPSLCARVREGQIDC